MLKKGVDYRFAKKWWLPTILLCPLIIGGALGIAALAGENIPELYWITDPSLILVNFFFDFVYWGSIARGVRLERICPS